MAKPAFIYAFDNLGPDRFTEICGLLLASRYKGFLLGGIGPDGGVDGELDEVLGEWRPESESPLLAEFIRHGQLVVFQFKHKVTARVGQATSRKQLLKLYKCSRSQTCELHRELILHNHPSAYVLVTNIEAGSRFRAKFIEQCKSENSDIEHYQVIGLDELETWITMEPQLRHLYFPTIFGPPQFALQILLSEGFADFYDDGSVFIDSGPRPKHLCDSAQPGDRLVDLLQVSVLNVGTVPSYIASIGFKFIVGGETRLFFWANAYQEAFPEMKLLKNPRFGTALEPGRRQVFRFPFYVVHKMKENVRNAFPIEILVYDEIGNMYSAMIPEELRKKMLE